MSFATARILADCVDSDSDEMIRKFQATPFAVTDAEASLHDPFSEEAMQRERELFSGYEDLLSQPPACEVTNTKHQQLKIFNSNTRAHRRMSSSKGTPWRSCWYVPMPSAHKGDGVGWMTVLRRFMTAHESCTTASAADVVVFKRAKFVSLALCATELELCPKGWTGTEWQTVLSALESGTAVHDESEEREAHSVQLESWVAMSRQHVRAMQVLEDSIGNAPLSVEMLVKVHSLLTQGSTVGLRTTPCCAAGYLFTKVERLPTELQHTIDRFEASVAKPQAHAVRIAADLVYHFATCHPFADGNERMCLILFAYALRRLGLPWACSLGGSGEEGHKAFLKALQRAQLNPGRKMRCELYWLALTSVIASTTNAARYIHPTCCGRADVDM